MKYHTDNKMTLFIYVILRVLVILTMIVQVFHRNYNNVFLCILTLVLFMIPVIVDKRFNIKLPTALEVIILLFIFAAEILGEIQNFYSVFEYWDVMLHTINGFLMAAIGFAMVDILNSNSRFHIHMSPVFVAFVAFCFSMTIGVVWEFFEFFMDRVFLMDMQKDVVMQAISTVSLNPEGKNIAVVVGDIQSTIINSVSDGQAVQYVIEGGYLDLGLMDTMTDLLVNFIGAVAFSIIGYFYIQGRGKLARNFIPRMKTKKEIVANNEEVSKKEIKKKKR